MKHVEKYFKLQNIDLPGSIFVVCFQLECFERETAKNYGISIETTLPSKNSKYHV